MLRELVACLDGGSSGSCRTQVAGIHLHTYIHTITLHYITLHYITLHYITLHYITYIHYIHTYITYIHTLHTYIHYIHTYIQYNTIQYNTIQYNTIQYNTIQYNTIQYNTIQYILYIYIFQTAGPQPQKGKLSEFPAFGVCGLASCEADCRDFSSRSFNYSGTWLIQGFTACSNFVFLSLDIHRNYRNYQ